MGISVPVEHRGIVINNEERVVRRLYFDEPTAINHPPSPNLKTKARFRQLLKQVHHRKPTKPKPQLPSSINLRSYPNGIRPILVPRASSPPLGPTAQLFKDKEQGRKSVPDTTPQSEIEHFIELDQVELPRVPRRKHPLVDISAVESDGEGGDIDSVVTTPEVAPSLEPTIPRVRPTISKPKIPVFKVTCEHCGTVTSSQKQLRQHQIGKKCRKIQGRRGIANIDLVCPTCRKTFPSLHNFHNHNCK